MIAGGLEWLGINPYQTVIWTGILFASAMLFMAGSCHAFRYLFQTGTCPCRSKTGDRMRSGQRWLNRYHPVIVWTTLVLGIIHISLAIKVVGLPTRFAQTTLILGWVLIGAFILWIGTCYYFRHLIEKYVFRHPPSCDADGSTEHRYTGDRWIYRYHRTFLYIVLILLPIHPSVPLTGSYLPGFAASGLVILGIVWLNIGLLGHSSTCCRRS